MAKRVAWGELYLQGLVEPETSYQKRIARNLDLGFSISQARGHARTSKNEKKVSEVIKDVKITMRKRSTKHVNNRQTIIELGEYTGLQTIKNAHTILNNHANNYGFVNVAFIIEGDGQNTSTGFFRFLKGDRLSKLKKRIMGLYHKYEPWLVDTSVEKTAYINIRKSFEDKERRRPNKRGRTVEVKPR